MNYKIFPPSKRSRLSFTPPLSKSISNRALLINALTLNPEQDVVYADCDDTSAMMHGLEATDGKVDIGAAGTAMRFLTAYFAVKEGADVVLDGSERMRMRPIGKLVDALLKLGAAIHYEEEKGYPPLKIKGKKLKGGDVEIDGSVSSQFISALMMAAPCMEEGAKIKLTGKIISLPYILMTARMMMQAGVPVMFYDRTIIIPPAKYNPVKWNIEGDWSGASYWYELTALGATNGISLKNMFQSSLQGDSALSRLFVSLGVDTSFITEDGVESALLTCVGHPVDRLELDLTSQPDIAQTIAVTSYILNIPFRLTGLSTLPTKETDRLAALRNELRRLGCIVEIIGNQELVWDGSRCEPEPCPVIRTYKDHRMAMAFAPASVKFPGLIIEDAGVVSKSYPLYWKDLKSAGFKFEEVKSI